MLPPLPEPRDRYLKPCLQLQKQLESEHRVYNDVLQHEFVDSFSNLTLKTAFALKWVTSGTPLNNCSFKFVYKTDDDTFVNPGKLWTALDHALLHTTTKKSLQPYLFKDSK